MLYSSSQENNSREPNFENTSPVSRSDVDDGGIPSEGPEPLTEEDEDALDAEDSRTKAHDDRTMTAREAEDYGEDEFDEGSAGYDNEPTDGGGGYGDDSHAEDDTEKAYGRVT